MRWRPLLPGRRSGSERAVAASSMTDLTVPFSEYVHRVTFIYIYIYTSNIPSNEMGSHLGLCVSRSLEAEPTVVRRGLQKYDQKSDDCAFSVRRQDSSSWETLRCSK